MEAEIFFRALAALVLVVLLWRAGRALWVGHLKVAGEIQSRADQPRRYWAGLAFLAFYGAILVLIVLAIPSTSPDVLLIGMFGGVVTEWLMARHDWRDRRSPAQRHQERSILLLATLALAAAAAALIWFFFLRT